MLNHVDNAINELDLLSARKSGYALIDYDQTLLLGNSTDLFLISAKPKVLIFFVVKLTIVWFKLCKVFFAVPPRAAEASALRFIIRFMPWNLRSWQRIAAPLLRERENPQLSKKLQSVPDDRIVICSNGYEEVVLPMLEGSRWTRCQLSFVPLFRDRKVLTQSKIERLEATLSADAIQKSVCVTDSEDDRDLLNAVDHPCLLTWDTEIEKYSYVPRFLPLSYTIFGKYPWRAALKVIFLRDYTIMLLALVFAAVNRDLAVMAGATCLFLSLYSIYETGYYDNDFHAAKLEDKPVVNKRAARFSGSHVVARALLWCVIFGAAGCWLVSGAEPAKMLRSGTIWAVVLGVQYATFKVYNLTRAERRTALYVYLQAIKYLGIYLIVTPVVQGLVLALAQIVMMSSRYANYRLGGRSEEFPSNQVRGNYFVLFSAIYCLYRAPDISSYDLVVFFVMGGWCAFGGLSSYVWTKLKKAN